MTNDQAGSPLSRLRPVHWVLTGLVVLSGVAAVVIAVSPGGDDPTAGPAARRAAAYLVSSSTCR